MYQKSCFFLVRKQSGDKPLSQDSTCVLPRWDHRTWQVQIWDHSLQACAFLYHWYWVLNLIFCQQTLIFLLNEDKSCKFKKSVPQASGSSVSSAICYTFVIVLSSSFSGWVNYSLEFYRTYLKLIQILRLDVPRK